jgi:outer membrane protein assembly factor BamB
VRRQSFVVLAVDRRDGSILWQREVLSELPHEGGHVTGSWASASAVTDGEHLYAHFGSIGLYALDLDGKLSWEKDFGDMQTKHGHGEGSSPALHGDTLVVNWDHQGESFVVAVDKHTGRERWKAARDELTSWSTPLVVEHQGRPQAIVSATNRVRGYDLADGEIVWECGGLSGNVVASPVAADGLVYVANSYDTRAMLAIRLASAEGDITGTDAVAWTLDRHTPYVPSPLLYDDALCFLKHYQGLLSCLEARTGRFLFGPQRLQGIRNVYASPVGAAGRIYIVDRNGATAVVRQGPSFELLAVNQLDDSFSASPAVVGEELFLRGERYLYSLAEENP